MSLLEHSRAKLNTRITISGPLVFSTAFHLGGGRSDFSLTDKPVQRDGDGRPTIPGSSVKGAVRATVERIAPNLGLTACGIFDESAPCLTSRENQQEIYRDILKGLNSEINDEFVEKINAILSWAGKTIADMPEEIVSPITEKTLLFLLDHCLCDVCKTFGAPFLESSIYFHDVLIDSQYWVGKTQIRDGVGIDRDSGRAVDGLLYDYEVVPPQTVFNFSMTIESDDPVVLGLAALGLHELLEGNIPLGGIKSRGLGRCKLLPEAKVRSVTLNDREALIAYLRGEPAEDKDITEFVRQNIEHILPKEDAHV